MYCYRHPDRETGLSCSECGRPICTDCMTVAPVGLRCPDHATNRPPPAQVARTAARSVAISAKNAYVTQVLIAVNLIVYIVDSRPGSGDQRPRRQGLREGAALRAGRRRRGLVAPDHVGVPARERPPHRLQHARALVVRRAGRALPRTRALPAHLHRLRDWPARPVRCWRRRTPPRSARPARSSGSSAPRSCSSDSACTSSAAARSRSSSSTSSSRSPFQASRSADISAGWSVEL